MERETVFYLDLLGFRSLVEGDGRSAIKALTAVAEVLGAGSALHRVGNWAHRYALSDSVFLSDPDPANAIRWAAQTARMLTKASACRVLIRGGVAQGEVQHLRSVFGESKAAANLLGVAVSQAVDLETKTGEKGPRIFVEEKLARELTASDPSLAAWLLVPTPAPEIWEILWLLPESPSHFAKKGTWNELRWLTTRALELLGERGGHPRFGPHYRGFARLAARSLQRIADWADPVPKRERVSEMLPRQQLVKVLDRTSGIPDLDALLLLQIADRLASAANAPAPV